MKKIITYFVALFITVFTLQAEQIKLLAIGNSFSDDAIEHYLYDIAYAGRHHHVICICWRLLFGEALQ